jgi:hypothetical protein
MFPFSLITRMSFLITLGASPILIFYVLYIQTIRSLSPEPLYLAVISNFSDISFRSKNCDSFVTGILEEAESLEKSADKCWWLDSGGIFNVKNGVSETIQGDLNPESYWKQIYQKNNPTDTDQGLHPQNIFRLVNKSKWQNISEQLLFRIKKYNQSTSPNRNATNGVLLMSRYVDGNNLYYAGLRVDGLAVIKKKINGTYITIASKQFANPPNGKLESTALPLDRWIGEKFVTTNNPDGSVRLQFFADLSGSGEWQLLLDVNDTTSMSGFKPINDPGNIGIRTDFMDVEFSNFRVETL